LNVRNTNDDCLNTNDSCKTRTMTDVNTTATSSSSSNDINNSNTSSRIIRRNNRRRTLVLSPSQQHRGKKAADADEMWYEDYIATQQANNNNDNNVYTVSSPEQETVIREQQHEQQLKLKQKQKLQKQQQLQSQQEQQIEQEKLQKLKQQQLKQQQRQQQLQQQQRLSEQQKEQQLQQQQKVVKEQQQQEKVINRVLHEVVEHKIEHAEIGYAEKIRLAQEAIASVVNSGLLESGLLEEEKKKSTLSSEEAKQTTLSSEEEDPMLLKKITRKRLAKGKIESFPAEEEPDFLIPKRPLQPGELSPLVWRDGTRVDEEAYLIGIPQETTDVIQEYMDSSGLYDLCHYLMYENKVDPGESRMYTIDDGYNWGAMGPKAWTTGDLTWVDAADERSYEKTLELLGKGNFDVVLDAVGKKFNLDGLMIQGVGVIIVSEWYGNNMHYDIGDTGNKFFNIIFPITIPSNGQGALHVGDRYKEKRHEPVNFRLNTGILLGGETRHGTGKCNYRKEEEFRIGIAVYMADLDEKNIEWISGDTTSLFPNVEDVPWFRTQQGRVWSKDGNSLKNDTGRKPFDVQDDPNVDCQKVKKKGQCITSLKKLRMKCPKTCEVYMKDDVYYKEIFNIDYKDDDDLDRSNSSKEEL